MEVSEIAIRIELDQEGISEFDDSMKLLDEIGMIFGMKRLWIESG